MYESFTKLSTPLRLTYLLVAALVWLVTLGGRVRRGRVVVLCYHNVRPDQAARFERQARAAHRRAAPLSIIDAPGRGFGRPRVVFTFDDAYANLLETVAPVMQRLDIPWSVYPVTGALGVTPTWSMPKGHPDALERTMTRAQVASTASSPLVEIGAHTRTHPPLATVKNDEWLRDELETPRHELAAIVGRDVETLALPHGSFDAPVLAAAQRAGYRRILTLEHALEPRRRADGAVARFSASPDIWPIEFRFLIDGAYAWLGAFRAWVKRGRNAA